MNIGDSICLTNSTDPMQLNSFSFPLFFKHFATGGGTFSPFGCPKIFNKLLSCYLRGVSPFRSGILGKKTPLSGIA